MRASLQYQHLFASMRAIASATQEAQEAIDSPSGQAFASLITCLIWAYFILSPNPHLLV
jgi:hypothetical protein